MDGKMDIALHQCKMMIKSILISSTTRMNIEDLLRSYHDLEGCSIPYQKFGYQSCYELLLDLKDIVIVEPGPQRYLTAIVNEKNAHLVQLIKHQKRMKKPSKNQRFPVLKNKTIVTTERINNSLQANGIQKCNSARDLISASCVNKSSEVDGQHENNQNTEKLIPPSESQPVTDYKGNVVDYNYKIPFQLQEELKELIKEHPEGIYSYDILPLYISKFKKKFNFHCFGFESVFSMCVSMPYIFQYRSAGHKYIFYDKNIEVPEDNVTVCQQLEHAFDNISIKSECIAPGPIKLTPAAIEILKSKVPIPRDSMQLGEIVKRNFPDLSGSKKKKVEIVLTEVYDLSKFWFRLVEYESELENLMDELQNFYNLQSNYETYLINTINIEDGLYIVAPHQGFWHRAVIVNKSVTAHDMVRVFYIDYAMVRDVYSDKLCYLHKQFQSLPAQVLRGRLSGLKPPEKDTNWTREAQNHFYNYVSMSSVFTKVDSVIEESETYSMTLYVRDETINKFINLNNRLQEDGYAIFEYEEEKAANHNYKVLVPNVYLYPSHEELEKGEAPNACELLILESTDVEWHVIHPKLFKVNNVQEVVEEETVFLSSGDTPVGIKTDTTRPTENTQQLPVVRPPPGFNNIASNQHALEYFKIIREKAEVNRTQKLQAKKAAKMESANVSPANSTANIKPVPIINQCYPKWSDDAMTNHVSQQTSIYAPTQIRGTTNSQSGTHWVPGLELDRTGLPENIQQLPVEGQPPASNNIATSQREVVNNPEEPSKFNVNEYLKTVFEKAEFNRTQRLQTKRAAEMESANVSPAHITENIKPIPDINQCYPKWSDDAMTNYESQQTTIYAQTQIHGTTYFLNPEIHWAPGLEYPQPIMMSAVQGNTEIYAKSYHSHTFRH